MLKTLRNAANNIVFKLILVGIVLSFVLFGIGDVIRGRNDYDLVKFKNLPSITLSHFIQFKKEAIARIEQNSKEKITDETLAQMGFDQQVISKLVQERLMEGWIASQNLTVGDKVVANDIKKSPNFQDDKGKFNADLYKGFISRLPIPEEEFYTRYKFDIATGLLQDNVKHTIHAPKLLEDVIIGYLSQVKTAKYVKVNIAEKGTLAEVKPSNEELQKFYEENKLKFQLPEERTLQYIIIDKKMINPNVKDSAEKQTKQLMEAIKQLEDAVAGGENIKEVAARYKAKIATFKGSFTAMEKDSILGSNADSAFAMNQNELSYPAELPEDKGYILFEVSDVLEGRVPPLDKIKASVTAEYIKGAYIAANIEKLKEFEAKVTAENFDELSKQFGFALETIDVRGRSDPKIPDELTYTILQTQPNKVSSLLILEESAYVAKTIKIATDKKQADIIKKSSRENISNHFKSSFIGEIMEYFNAQNNTEVRMELLGTQGN